MKRKLVSIENSLHQMQEFVIEEYDEHIVLSGFLSRGIENVEIPEMIECKPVTVIGDGCFFTFNDIKAVNFPETIVSIGIQAFAMCKGLKEIIIPNSVTEIAPYAFRDCSGIKKFVFSQNIKCLRCGIFSFCYLNDAEIILPEGLEVIECNAFYSAGDFDLVIPDSVKEIGVGAFYWGPRPITGLPEDEGWYSHWPYGEKVIASELQGRITGFHYLEHQCMLYDITFDSDSELKQYVYPCDYIDGNIRFLKDRNQKIVQEDIKKYWGTEEKIENAYKIMNAWKRGFIAPH